MTKQTIWLTTNILTAMVVACGTPQTKNNATELPPIFTLNEPPMTIADEQQRVNFLVEKYWSATDFADTTLNGSRKTAFEEAVVNYLYMLPYVDSINRQKGFKDMYQKAWKDEPTMFFTLQELVEHHLNHPNSYMRNEALYIQALQVVLALEQLEPVEQIRPKEQLELAQKNRIGTQAKNFFFTTRTGGKGELYAIKSDYTLLFFNAPDCFECQSAKEFLTNSPVIDSLVASKRLTILALYTGELDSLWRATTYPKQWINAQDQKKQIEHEKLYDLRATPNLLLFDRQKKVLLKDARMQHVEAYFNAKIEAK